MEMQYLGETISLGVACSWTVTALVSEIGTRRIGVMNFNVWRLFTAMVLSIAFCFYLTGHIGPAYAGPETWFWMSLSGFVGFFLGDYCLFKSYLYISSRYTQLFMTLAPATAAIVAWITLGETMTWGNVIAMAVTLSGIALTVLGKGEDGKKLSFNLPWQGMLLAMGAGLGQGCGLVLSKIGMEHYQMDIPAEALADMQSVIPFSANMIRCIAGFLCFFVVAAPSNLPEGRLLKDLKDGKAMRMMLTAVMFGPFLGVGFSLMAVQYTNVGIAQTLMALTPILIILPSYWIFKQPITLKGCIGAVVSVIGAALFFLI